MFDESTTSTSTSYNAYITAAGTTAGGGGDITVTIDQTSPIITLNGADPYTLEQGSTWTAPSASVNDGSSLVIGGDTVDPNTPGSYVINYNATDTAGNAANQVQRTVNVIANFDYWAQQNGLTAGINDGFLANPDNDGKNNGREFAHDGDPLSAISRRQVPQPLYR